MFLMNLRRTVSSIYSTVQYTDTLLLHFNVMLVSAPPTLHSTQPPARLSPGFGDYHNPGKLDALTKK